MAAASRSPSELDHFERLGLVREFSIDRDALEVAYLDRSRQTHPDRFVGAEPHDRRVAMETSAALNSAYRILRDPVARAEYLVALAGIDLDSSDRATGAPHPTQAFLIAMIERRERLADASASDLHSLRGEVELELGERLDRVVAALATDDNRGAALELVHRRYLQRFHDEIEALVEEPD